MNAGGETLTEGVIWKKILYFAIPIFLGNLCQQLYNTMDAVIVGRFLDDNALAAVNSSGSLIFMLVGFFSGVSTGAGVVIAKYFGAKDEKNLRIAVHTDIAFGLAAGAALTLIGVMLTPQILRWMKTPEDVLPNSIAYFRIYFCGAMGNLMYNISVGILQAVGDSKHPLYYLMAATGLNVVLDILFVGVFHWGVWAAALATIISQLLSAVLALWRLCKPGTVYQLKVREIGFNGPMLGRIVRFGLPSGVQNSVIALANVVVQSNINSFGASAMAGCGSYSKIEGFAFLPITCFTMALTTFMGQNLGARQYDRAKKGARFGILTSMILAELVGVVVWTCAPYLLRLFSDSPEVIGYGMRQAKTIALFYCLLAFSHCIAGIMRGAGKAAVPMVIMLLAWCVIRVTYITIAVGMTHQIQMVFWAYPITWSISSVIFLIYFFKADWIHNFERIEQKARTI